jgi:superfamily II DNA/RNA helicase
MTEIQALATKSGLLEGENMILTAETGSGKTLTYLLPVLNQLFHYKDKKHGQSPPRFRLTKENEEMMFLNAEEIAYKEQKEGGAKRLSFSRGSGSD